MIETDIACTTCRRIMRRKIIQLDPQPDDVEVPVCSWCRRLQVCGRHLASLSFDPDLEDIVPTVLDNQLTTVETFAAHAVLNRQTGRPFPPLLEELSEPSEPRASIPLQDAPPPEQPSTFLQETPAGAQFITSSGAKWTWARAPASSTA